MRFFVGLHQPSDAKHFACCFISINRLLKRKSDFDVSDWIMDSGAYTEITRRGEFRLSVPEYAARIRRWSKCGNLLAAVAQDYVCAPEVLQVTGLTIEQHQLITVELYRELLAEQTGVYIMPVIQGNTPGDYVQHIRMYGKLLQPGAWVGVGSVVSKSSKPEQVEQILQAILNERPDLQLHGFGIKTKAFTSPQVRAALTSSDSMAWSFAARYEGRNRNHWSEAKRYANKINLYNILDFDNHLIEQHEQ